jgi:hypothetical protein
MPQLEFGKHDAARLCAPACARNHSRVPVHFRQGELPMVPKKASEKALPASLLRRVAEAADGLRDGRPHWFLVSLKAPHSAVPFDSAKAADKALAKRGRGKFALLGPYLTKPEPAPKAARRKKRKVRSVLIYYEGEKKPVEVDLAKVDAIFLSESALDKFVYPYFSRVHGVEQTARMRNSFMTEDEPVSFHMPWSDWP